MSLKNTFKFSAGMKLSNYHGPKPEHFNYYTYVYSFTFSPSDAHQPEDLDFKNFSTTFRKLFDSLFMSCHIICHCEFSQNNRFHFHGTIKIIDPYRFWMIDIIKLRRFGDVDIDTIEDLMTWNLYCRKMQIIYDGQIMQELFENGLQIYYDNNRHKLIQK